MPRLTAGVVLRRPDTGERVFLPTGSDLPEWASGLVGPHVLDGATTTERPPAEPAAPKPDGPKPPPKAGSGSGRAKWAEYAAAHGVEVTDDMSRDEIVDAVEAAGARTE